MTSTFRHTRTSFETHQHEQTFLNILVSVFLGLGIQKPIRSTDHFTASHITLILNLNHASDIV